MSGQIKLAITNVKASAFNLIHTHDGVGIPLDNIQSDGATQGTSLIESLVDQLKGRMTTEGGPKGTYYHIRSGAR